MTPIVQAWFDTATNTVSYLVHDPATREAAIIDPVLDFTANNARISTTSADAILAAVAEQGLTVRWLLETHAHADHLSAAPFFREHLGAKVGIGAHIKQVQTIFKEVFNLEKEFLNKIKTHTQKKIQKIPTLLQGPAIHLPHLKLAGN